MQVSASFKQYDPNKQVHQGVVVFVGQHGQNALGDGDGDGDGDGGGDGGGDNGGVTCRRPRTLQVSQHTQALADRKYFCASTI